MKKLKMILPMLAFVLAIGMSFAFVGTSAEKDYYATKYILVDGGWATIDVVCNPQNDECLVRFSDDLTQKKYVVFDAKDDTKPSNGDGFVMELNGSVPNADLN